MKIERIIIISITIILTSWTSVKKLEAEDYLTQKRKRKIGLVTKYNGTYYFVKSQEFKDLSGKQKDTIIDFYLISSFKDTLLLNKVKVSFIKAENELVSGNVPNYLKYIYLSPYSKICYKSKINKKEFESQKKKVFDSWLKIHGKLYKIKIHKTSIQILKMKSMGI